ncbi:MAG: DegV family protein [Oscillospiraceae bacterium]|nr:DegV family protein [Oscillospiraceae bacterium]
MPNKIIITCDSTCDLSPELYRKYEIVPVPLGVILGEELRKDGVDVKAPEIFEYVDKTGNLPKTSAVSVDEYTRIFKKYVDKGSDVVHINISSEFSSCYQNACIAAEEFPGHVYPIDSRNLSTGSGHLAIRARTLADDELTAPEIAARINEMKDRLDVSFVLQTLTYLQKGGRCSGVTAFGANLLKIRPEIIVQDGNMVVGKKYRGDMEKTILNYVRGRLEGRTDIDTHRIFITHSYVPHAIVDKVRDLIKELQPFDDSAILETFAGCTVSCHCGPYTLGVLFFKKKQ